MLPYLTVYTFPYNYHLVLHSFYILFLTRSFFHISPSLLMLDSWYKYVRTHTQTPPLTHIYTLSISITLTLSLTPLSLTHRHEDVERFSVGRGYCRSRGHEHVLLLSGTTHIISFNLISFLLFLLLALISSHFLSSPNAPNLVSFPRISLLYLTHLQSLLSHTLPSMNHSVTSTQNPKNKLIYIVVK
jgi:hypothetical protein